ncbi:MAG: HEPN domain-containing protein [Bacteroidota bacterium]
MNNADVLQLLDECAADLDKVKSIIDSLGQTSHPVPYLTKYSIIKACGTIEIAYKNLVADYCSKRSKPQIKNYIDNKVRDSSRNPTFSNMCNLLNEFDDAWNDKFKDLVSNHPDKNTIQTSLTSLVDARNEFAHGGNPTVTITDVIKQYCHSRIVIELMDSVLV